MPTLRFVILIATLGPLTCGPADDAPIDPAPSSGPPPAAGSQEWSPPSAPAQPAELMMREPCTHHDPLRQAFFGDLHTHTAFSLDALGRGGFQTPDDAYRFARGEALGLSPLDEEGRPTRTARLARPLDFAAVTDHSEWLGEVAVCTDPASPVYDTPACLGIRPGGTQEERAAWQGERRAGRGPVVCGDDGSQCREGLLTAWGETQVAAERHYDRSSDCVFTTFHAWEFSRAPGLSKVHRNVILRNEIAPELPISWIDAAQPEDLWTRLKARCNDTDTGCEALTIPHNPNISNGQMFTLDWGADPIDQQRARASLRAEMEPLVEMMQSKGESECRRGMWGVVGGEDELCDFEKIRFIDGMPPPDCEDGMGVGALRGEGCQSRLDFVRYALIEGLVQEDRLGINPLQFGLIGSTDDHNGAPGDTDEYDYQGHNSNVDSDLQKRLTTPAYAPHKLRNPGGLIGVWAEENSRDSLFDAMLRKETFGTSGVRIQVRLFGGWNLPELCTSPDMIAEAYESGVPMGSVLPSEDVGDAPMLFVTALADPGTGEHPGTPLQRIQIVKGWVGDDGQFHEVVYDVAGNADNGAGVSRETCVLQGEGSGSLCAVWTDPEFDPSRSAVYYARVLENPSCRWNAWQCVALPEDDRPAACGDPQVPWTIQERAWSSPIWYEAH
ncbi:MAG: DUF3604 domain-containing protein [Acidobacteriota bacterium]|nr:DUF3604 domain-containing protein [Acidobacteriota bacterium]